MTFYSHSPAVHKYFVAAPYFMKRPLLCVLCPPRLLSVYCYHAADAFYRVLHPLNEHCMQLPGVYGFHNIPKCTCIWYAILQFDILFQPFFLAFAEHLYLYIGCCPAYHCCQKNEQHFMQRVPYALLSTAVFYPFQHFQQTYFLHCYTASYPLLLYSIPSRLLFRYILLILSLIIVKIPPPP